MLHHEGMHNKLTFIYSIGQLILSITSSLLQSLNHPNIVEIKAIISEPSMLVMEFIPMGSLLAYLRAQKDSISDHQLLKFATDVAEVIIYIFF